MRKNRLRENPATFEMPRVERVVRRNFVVQEEVKRLIAAAQHDDLKFVLYCGFHAGMRHREICEAAPWWFSVPETDERRGRITIEQTASFRPKDREGRTVPLTGEFQSFLRGYLAKVPRGALWVMKPNQKHGKQRYRADFSVRFYKHMKDNGVKCTPHDMRRSFVSNKLIEDSSLIFKMAKWTGTDVSILQAHYGHLLADDDDIDVGV